MANNINNCNIVKIKEERIFFTKRMEINLRNIRVLYVGDKNGGDFVGIKEGVT